MKGQFADSLESKYDKEIKDYQVRFSKSEQIQENLELKNYNQSVVISNKDQSIEILTEQLNDRDKRLRNGKWQKILLGAATIVTSVAIILK